jgi:hypothetical protein
MAQDLTAAQRTIWSREMQQYFFTEVVMRAQANFRLEAELQDGVSIKRVIGSAGIPQDYTRYSDVTANQLVNSSETLTVDKCPTIPFIISNLDELQSMPKQRDYHTQRFMDFMKLIVNGWYLAEVTNATQVIDAADFGGTAGLGAQITPANVQKMFVLAQKKLSRYNTFKKGQMFANLTPDLYQALLDYRAGKNTEVADGGIGTDGVVDRYMGFDIFVHNGGYWTGKMYLATQPTDGDTVTIIANGQTITFTFKTTIGSTAGNVLIGGSAATAGANLAALINAPGTTTANGVALSLDQQAALYGCTATFGSSLLSLTWRGVGAPITSSVLTATTDGWNIASQSAQKNISHNMFGVRGAVDFVMQKQIGMEVDKLQLRIGEYIIKPYTLFGRKTFVDGAKKLIDVKVDTTSYT